MMERHARGASVAVVPGDRLGGEPNLLEERVRCEHEEYFRCGWIGGGTDEVKVEVRESPGVRTEMFP